MKYYIIAGEASGDLYGSRLIDEIKSIDKEADNIWNRKLLFYWLIRIFYAKSINLYD